MSRGGNVRVYDERKVAELLRTDDVPRFSSSALSPSGRYVRPVSSLPSACVTFGTLLVRRRVLCTEAARTMSATTGC